MCDIYKYLKADDYWWEADLQKKLRWAFQGLQEKSLEAKRSENKLHTLAGGMLSNVPSSSNVMLL